jgi:hypothetical protein
MKRWIASSPLLFALLLAPLAAQDAKVITEARTKEVVSWLASDERQGRDTPSPGLDAAADWIAERFAKAGLTQAVPDSWFHTYTLPGIELDSGAITFAARITVTVEKDGQKKQETVTRTLKADEEVRLLRAGDAVSGQDQEASMAYADDPRIDRLLMAGGGRRPTVLEVPADHAAWTAAGGKRRSMKDRLLGTAPIFLVKQGVLPAADKDTQVLVTWSAPAPVAIDLPLRNVVGCLKGSSKPDEYVLVSSHYDHIGVGRAVDGDGIFNGADDDASGTTAVILLAESLAKQQPRPARSILFVCFSAEEKGLRGSAAFAETPPVPLTAVVANLNIEMIGRPEAGKQKAAWITGVEYSDFATIAGPALQAGGIQLVEFGMAKQLFMQSDNMSLARKGVVAHSISAGSLHKDYHQVSDEVDKLDIPHMTAVIAGLEPAVRAFADRAERPSYNDEGKKMLERIQQQRRGGRRGAQPAAEKPAGGGEKAEAPKSGG